MRTRDVITGLVVLGLLIGGIFWIRKVKMDRQSLTVTPPTVEEKIPDTFNGLIVPTDTEKTELKDVSGETGAGIATRDMVLADLPDPEVVEYYQVFVDDKPMGVMGIVKGGFLFEGKIEGEKVSVKLGDKTILEGSF